MKKILSSIWRYIILVASVSIIAVQSVFLVDHFRAYNWYGVLIDVIIIALFAYVLWNRCLKKDKPSASEVHEL